MAKIVFAWELGSGYGHIAKFLQVAHELSKRGHQIFCIAKELQHLAPRIQSSRITLLQAPVWQQEKVGVTSYCYAELLLNIGYYDNLQIQGKLMAWQSLYDLIKPDLLIAEHAPTALLAAHGRGFPATTLGTGFFTPPACFPAPAFYSDANLGDDQLILFEQKILLQINHALGNLGLPLLKNLTDIFKCDDIFLCTHKELDHYPGRKHAEYLGAHYELPCNDKAEWPDHIGPKIFAYLKPGFSEIEKMLQALKLTEASIIVHAPAFSENLLKKYSSPHIQFYNNAINIDLIGTQVTLAICHAGHGTITNMLLKGVPLLLIPMQMEQLVLATRVKDLGAAEIISPMDPIRNYRKTIKRLLNNQEYKKQAIAFSRLYADINPEQQRNKIADRCEALLNS